MTIHWCGTGLSAIPGLRALIEEGLDVKVWNRTASKAQEAVGDLTNNIAVYDIDVLGNEFSAGDVVVSCLLYTSPSPRDRTRSRMPSSA